MAGSPKKRARRDRVATVVDPLDEEAPRQPLKLIPWNKTELTEEGREAVTQALLEGYPRNQIARALGTTVKTLKRLIDQDPALLDAIDARKDAEEAELREILVGLARQGDTVAAIFLGKSQYGWRDREDGKAQPVPGGGVLLVPAHVPLDEWSAAVARQQAQFREAPREVVEQMTDRKVEVDRQRHPHSGSPGIEGLRLVNPAR
jgi:hypothetical protein